MQLLLLPAKKAVHGTPKANKTCVEIVCEHVAPVSTSVSDLDSSHPILKSFHFFRLLALFIVED